MSDLRKKARSAKPIHGGLSTTELRALGMSSEDVIDFSVNINPLGPPAGAKDALTDIDISCYPDPESLRLKERLSRVDGIDPDQIIIGNGSTEILHLIAHSFLDEGDRVAIFAPTFGEYVVAAKRGGGNVTFLHADEERGFVWDIGEVCEAIRRSEPKTTFLCNPNNPTGVYLDGKEVERILEAVGEGLLILDEAYVAFVDRAWDSRSLLEHENFIIVRSMTKDYALAGLRLGYALCCRDIVQSLGVRQPSWSVNAAAQAAGLAALADRGYLLKAKNCIKKSKDYLCRELQGLRYKVIAGAANFMMVKVGNAALLREVLLKQGICVRDCSSFGLPEYIRIGIRTMPECKLLINVLKRVISQEYGDLNRAIDTGHCYSQEKGVKDGKDFELMCFINSRLLSE